jgi:ribose transport system permease protein
MSWLSHIRVAFRSYGILIALAGLVLLVQFQNDSFLTPSNLYNLGEQWASVGVMAVGMTFVLIGRGFDLSVGSTFAFSATLCASMSAHHSTATTVMAAAGVGAGVGLANGLLITKANINPFITTFATAEIVRGLAEIYSDGKSYVTDNSFFDKLGSGEIAGGVPVSLVVMGALFVVGGLVLAYSTYGRALYATGGNDEASFLSGLRTDWIRASTYVISGLCAALAGAIYVGRLGSGRADIGVGIEFDVIAAALIGGISIAGGEGAMWRAFAGVALLAVLQNYFNQSDIGSFWQSVAKGVIILGAVAVDSYAKRERKRPLRVTLALLARRLGRRTVATRRVATGSDEP